MAESDVMSNRSAARFVAPIRTFPWFFVLVFTAYPLGAIAAQLTGVDNRVVSVAMRGLVLLLACAVAGAAFMRRRELGGTRAFWVAGLVFWTAYSMRLFNDLLLSVHPLLKAPSEYVTFTFGTCVVPMFAAMLRTTPGERDQARVWLTRALIVACTGAIVVEVLSLARGETVLDLQGGRLGSATLNPISLGQMGAILASLVVARVAIGRQPLLSVFSLSATALGLAALLGSASRGPMVALVVALMALAGVRAMERFGAHILRLALVVGLVAVASIYSARYFEDSLGLSTVSRVALLFSGAQDESSAERVRVIRRAVAGFEDSPLVGYGIEEYSSRNYPHNILLDALMSTGLAGGIPIIVLFAIGTHAALRLMRSGSVDAWLGVVFIQLLIETMLSGDVWESGTLWVALAATVATLASRGAGQSPVAS